MDAVAHSPSIRESQRPRRVDIRHGAIHVVSSEIHTRVPFFGHVKDEHVICHERRQLEWRCHDLICVVHAALAQSTVLLNPSFSEIRGSQSSTSRAVVMSGRLV